MYQISERFLNEETALFLDPLQIDLIFDVIKNSGIEYYSDFLGWAYLNAEKVKCVCYRTSGVVHLRTAASNIRPIEYIEDWGANVNMSDLLSLL